MLASSAQADICKESALAESAGHLFFPKSLVSGFVL